MTWNVTNPPDNEAISLGASRIREFKSDLALALVADGATFPGPDTANPKYYYALRKGTTADRPAASADYPGRLYWNTTTATIQRVKDDGSGWEDTLLNPATFAIHQKVAAALASVVGVVTLPETTNSFNISGTEAVTSFAGWSAGVFIVKWVSSRVLTHNGSTLILMDAVSRTVAVNDISVFEFTAADSVREIGRLTPRKAPTRQYLSSGSSATYTTPDNCRSIRVWEKGGGAGGAANDTHDGADGSDTSFNSIVAKGGSKGIAAGADGAGGTGGAGSAFRRPGVVGFLRAKALYNMDGQAAPANSGMGGAGGTYFSGGNSGGSGGEGEVAEFTIDAPAATYTYTVGAGGAGGAVSNQAGGAGGSGLIIVDEFYY